jgi:1,4-dihydroxy-2-naphthoate polyprenyltransferase
MNPWLLAARPRTLPLALSSILMGSFLAAAQHQFSWTIFLLASLTTICLQVLSNFANDYGDTVSGVDSVERVVAVRAVQSGQITRSQMLRAIIIASILSLVAGSWLIYEALQDTDSQTIISFFGLGILSIIAAITYTIGKRPYGYMGLGDMSVFIFFGIVGVMGTNYLHTHILNWSLFLPAISCGLFAVGVLNINNIRDIESDTKSGKNSIPVRLGKENAVIYQWILLMLGFACSIFYVAWHFQSYWQLLFFVTLPLLTNIGFGIQKSESPAEIDPFLKVMALTTLLFVVTFGVGHLV